MSARKLELYVPVRIFEMLDRIEKNKGIKKEDLIMRSIVKVLEEFGEK